MKGIMPPRFGWDYPRMEPAAVFGELSADRSTICVVMSGDPYSQAQAAAQFSLFTPLGKEIAGGHALTLPCTWPTVVQLAMTFGPQWTAGPVLQDWIFREAARRTIWRDQELRYQIPPGLELRPWQFESVRQIAHVGCLLEDEPRLGKTISAIVGLAERECWEYPTRPILVICPASVVTTWVTEIKKWAPHWRVTAWRGPTPSSRRALVGHFDAYVTSYDLCRNDAPGEVPLSKAPLRRIKPKSVVLDEYHWISNPEAKRTRAAQRMARMANLVIPLSGTPFLHDFSGTAPTLDVFEPGAFPSKERIQERYCLQVPQDYGRKIVVMPERLPELRACFLGRQLRRARQDVASFLGEATYDTRVIEIPDPYRKIYDDMEQTMIAELDSGAEITAMNTILKMLRLQQLSASACDVHVTYTENPVMGGPDIEHQHLTPRLPSWKIDAMLDILAELEWPAIVFAPSRPLIELAGKAAATQGARVGYVIGGQRAASKDADIEAFQAGRLDAIFITAAGGTGLTLHAAGSVIFLQRHPSYVVSKQAEDRGIGGDLAALDVVDIFAANTVDQRIREILHHKAGQQAEYLNDPRIVRQLFGGKVRPEKGKKTA